MAGLNYFLTDEARGGTQKKLLGEKKDVKVWLAWLDRRAHNDVEAIRTPIGDIPRYDDLNKLFQSIIDKAYPEDLYQRQFSLYIDKIISRIDLQIEAYNKEKNIPKTLFKVLNEQREGLMSLRDKFGAIVTPSELERLKTGN